MPSQRLQEADDAGVLMPLLGMASLRDIAMSQCLGLHLQIHFGVDMGRIQRHVPQPAADGVDIHTRSQQMDGACVPNRVRTDPFVPE
jgi:hypothetical protein